MQINYLPTNFSDIKTSIITAFKASDSKFKDYTFSEGSTLNYIADFFAYITTYLNFGTGVSVNENYIHSAQIDKNIYNLAKSLGYCPKRKSAAYADIIFRPKGLTFNATTDAPVTDSIYAAWIAAYSPDQTKQIVIPTNSVIKSGNYSFITMEQVTLAYYGGVWRTAKTITDTNGKVKVNYDCDTLPNTYQVKQGSWNSLTYNATGLDYQTFKINSLEVDDNPSSIQVYTLNPTTTNNIEMWTELLQLDNFNYFTTTELFTQSISTLSDTRLYIIRQDDTGLNFYFGDNVLGAVPEDDKYLVVKYFTTSGSLANGLKTFTFSSAVSYEKLVSSVLTTSTMTGSSFAITLSSTYSDGTLGGAAAETAFSIKALAPLTFGGQHRLVEDKDFETWLLSQKYVPLSNVLVKRGEDFYPPMLGTMICIASKPFASTNFNYAYMSGTEKYALRDIMRKINVGGIEIDFKDPDFIRVGLDVECYYKNLLYDSTQVANIANSLLDAYFEGFVGFNNEFKQSNLVAIFDNADAIDSVIVKPNLSYLRKLDAQSIILPQYINLANTITSGSIANDVNFWFTNETSLTNATFVYNHYFFERIANGITVSAGVSKNRIYDYSIYDLDGIVYLTEDTYNNTNADLTGYPIKEVVDSRTCIIGEIDYTTGFLYIDFSKYASAEEKFYFEIDSVYDNTTGKVITSLEGLFLNPTFTSTANKFFYLSFAFNTVKQNFKTSGNAILTKGPINLHSTGE